LDTNPGTIFIPPPKIPMTNPVAKVSKPLDEN
jgi:hypothetical protein